MDMQPQDVGKNGNNAFAERLNGSRNGNGAPYPTNTSSSDQDVIRAAPDTSGPDRLRPDMSGHLTVKETQVFLFEHGLPRNERSIRRYCNNGALACVKIDTATGREWVVEKKSLEIYLEEQLQFVGQAHETRTEPDVSGHLSEPDRAPEMPENNELVETLKESLVEAREQLKKKDQQLEKKDEQITAMLERDRETNILIQNLERMVLQLQAPASDTSGHDRT